MASDESPDSSRRSCSPEQGQGDKPRPEEDRLRDPAESKAVLSPVAPPAGAPQPASRSEPELLRATKGLLRQQTSLLLAKLSDPELGPALEAAKPRAVSARARVRLDLDLPFRTSASDLTAKCSRTGPASRAPSRSFASALAPGGNAGGRRKSAHRLRRLGAGSCSCADSQVARRGHSRRRFVADTYPLSPLGASPHASSEQMSRE